MSGTKTLMLYRADRQLCHLQINIVMITIVRMCMCGVDINTPQETLKYVNNNTHQLYRQNVFQTNIINLFQVFTTQILNVSQIKYAHFISSTIL